MITDEQFSQLGIDSFLYEKSLSDVPLIGSVKITDTLYGRFDLIINKYYNGNILYLPILMDFNKISDPIQINLGRVFLLPDIDYLLSIIKINQNIFEENPKIPGINSSMDSKINNQKTLQSLNNNSNKITASPKLNIQLEKVKYDPQSGVITL